MGNFSFDFSAYGDNTQLVDLGFVINDRGYWQYTDNFYVLGGEAVAEVTSTERCTALYDIGNPNFEYTFVTDSTPNGAVGQQIIKAVDSDNYAFLWFLNNRFYYRERVGNAPVADPNPDVHTGAGSIAYGTTVTVRCVFSEGGSKLELYLTPQGGSETLTATFTNVHATLRAGTKVGLGSATGWATAKSMTGTALVAANDITIQSPPSLFVAQRNKVTGLGSYPFQGTYNGDISQGLRRRIRDYDDPGTFEVPGTIRADWADIDATFNTVEKTWSWTPNNLPIGDHVLDVELKAAPEAHASTAGRWGVGERAMVWGQSNGRILMHAGNGGEAFIPAARYCDRDGNWSQPLLRIGAFANRLATLLGMPVAVGGGGKINASLGVIAVSSDPESAWVVEGMADLAAYWGDWAVLKLVHGEAHAGAAGDPNYSTGQQQLVDNIRALTDGRAPAQMKTVIQICGLLDSATDYTDAGANSIRPQQYHWGKPGQPTSAYNMSDGVHYSETGSIRNCRLAAQTLAAQGYGIATYSGQGSRVTAIQQVAANQVRMTIDLNGQGALDFELGPGTIPTGFVTPGKSITAASIAGNQLDLTFDSNIVLPWSIDYLIGKAPVLTNEIVGDTGGARLQPFFGPIEVTADTSLTVTGSTHQQSADAATLSGSGSQSAFDMVHAAVSDATLISGDAVQVVSGSAHAASSDALTLTVAAPGELSITGTVHGSASDVAVLTGAGNQSIGDARHSTSAEAPVLTYVEPGGLSVLDTVQASSSDVVALPAAGTINVASATHVTRSDIVSMVEGDLTPPRAHPRYRLQLPRRNLRLVLAA